MVTNPITKSLIPAIYMMNRSKKVRKEQPIQKRKLSHEVRDRLLEMIDSGELISGEKMPSEHEIMDMFKVGRPAVREALQTLENMGVISISQGERATIRAISAETVLEQIDFGTRQLLNSSAENIEYLKEARQTFEAGVVRLVAVRHTEDDLRKLRVILEEMEESIGNLPVFLKKDREFHITLAEITGNPILAAAARGLLRWLSDWAKSLLNAPGLEHLTLEEHRKVYKALEAGEPDLAAQHVSDHILRINNRYQQLNDSK